MSNLNVSLSPHVHSGNSVQRCMLDVLIALTPALCVSFWYFGIGALVVTLTSVAACVLFEYLIQKFVLRVKPQLFDLSAVLTGVLLAFNVPSNLPIWIIIIGALIAIGVGKMSFGGLGQNIFNPALVGRVFLLVAFPAQMTTWPAPMQQAHYTDVTTGATPLYLFQQYVGGDASALEQMPSALDMLLGMHGGSMGEVCALALIIGGIYLLCRKTITWHIPVSILLAAFCTAFFCYGLDCHLALQQVLAGGLILGAVYMATDYVTSPVTPRGQLLYGCLIGFIAILIRRFGSYPEGMSFAILLLNACTPLINKYIKPRRFGVVKK